MTTKKLDSAYITRAYTSSQQIRLKLGEIIHNSEKALHELPNSIIPSELLLNIAVAYIEVYDKLLEHNLVTTGSHKEHKTIQ